MKFVVIWLALSATFNAGAQTPYTSTVDRSSVILNGIISKFILANNSNFPWFADNSRSYKPDTSVVAALASAKQRIHLVIFGGTWCEDTQNVLPKFFKIQEQSGFPDGRITFFGVDRSKKTIGGIADAFGITNVPTIIVMQNGKEIGRVVEYGKTGQWDKELAELIK